MKSWKADSDCCSWDGITCDTQNVAVIGLHLSNSWLNGPLNSNSSLFSLRHLRKLNLAFNNFTSSTIPSEFGQLVRLIHFNLSFSFLYGQIPLEISRVSNLVSLDLSFNYYEKLLDLRRIDLEAHVQNMTYSKFPLDIFLLSKIQAIDLMNNQLIGQIPELLVIRNNHFQGNLPEMFINGCSLKALDLNHNQIQGQIPLSLVKCHMLDDLNLGNNKLNDTFPFWLVSLLELKILVLRANGFYGPIWDPHINFGLSKLHVIDLSHNNFSSKLPSEYFQNWSAILGFTGKDKSQPRYMRGDSNYYKDLVTIVSKGQEMELVKTLTIFTTIDLSNNRFYGEIPNSVGNLKALIVLNLSGNNFMSHIPSSLGNLIELQSLGLSRNSLFGKIPQQLASLTFLEYLNLSQN
ncbi:hypothetical protein ACB098_03G182000 [Castanea mollissima]